MYISVSMSYIQQNIKNIESLYMISSTSLVFHFLGFFFLTDIGVIFPLFYKDLFYYKCRLLTSKSSLVKPFRRAKKINKCLPTELVNILLLICLFSSSTFIDI